MHSAIAWFARNPVAANLLMLFIVAAGLLSLQGRIPLEVFPSFELDRVQITTTYRGALPEEVEEGVTIPLEESVQTLEGIKRITSVAREGSGTVVLEVQRGYEPEQLLDDVRQRIESLGTLPENADEPTVSIPSRNREVISVVVAADLPERELRGIADRVRDELEALDGVSSVQVSGARDYEIAIEIPAAVLERHGLTLAAVGRAIQQQSVDLSGGVINTRSGDVLLRSLGQARDVEAFANLSVASTEDGTRIRLGDIADIDDGFDESRLEQRFNGTQAIEIDVYRTGYQSAIAVADTVKQYIAESGKRFPSGITLGYWRDNSEVVKQRLATLTNSAIQGGLLIIILLTLFLRFRVALWVFVGVPVSILGGIALMPFLGVSLNLLSLFAFILVLGIVVDDAIVTGENIFTRMKTEPDSLKAVTEGAQEVAMPVTFGVLTTVTAFTPLLMVEGVRGQLFAQIPLIVIPVLLFSIIESKFVLPSHLRHAPAPDPDRLNAFQRVQQAVSDGLERFVTSVYQPVLRAALRNRYPVLALFIALALLMFALVSSGQLRFVYFPRVPSETVRLTLTMPQGTPFALTNAHIERMRLNMEMLRDQYASDTDGNNAVRNIMTTAGSAGGGSRGSNRGRIVVELSPPDERVNGPSSREIVAQWQRLNGQIPGAESLSYRAEIGRGGSALDVQLASNSIDALKAVAARISERLAGYPGVLEVSDSFQGGSEELQLRLKPQAEQLGLTLSDIATQVRSAYLGDQIQRLQRDRDEVTVVVRYPSTERSDRDTLARLGIVASDGQRVRLSTVADIQPARSLPEIRRIDRKRTLNVEAEVDKQTTDIEAIKRDLERLAAEELAAQFPDVSISLEGEAREQRESFASLRTGLIIVLLVIYTLLAIPFKSYGQPLLVMAVIPFGVVGGILGHMLMGMTLSIMSYLGMLALCGVVVNDSLVLVDWINRQRAKGRPLFEAVAESGVARFRAVILTSLTTFFGLLPLIFENSTQAQFLIPMAVSLGYGILFATFVTLILIPINYLVLEDVRRLLSGKPDRILPQVKYTADSQDSSAH